MIFIFNRLKNKIKNRFPRFSKYLRKTINYYLIASLNLWLGKKAVDFWGRCREVCADPDNKYIPRVKDAGKIVDGYLIMHNGIKVLMGEFAYCNDFADIIFTTNKGVHEPQEERVFMEVLRHLPKKSTMIELGSYWAFYSMWFKKEVQDANCYMIEPNEERLVCGEKNFALNKMTGSFIKGKIGNDAIRIDDFIKEKNLDVVHMLHSDIQGWEFQMLQSCEQSIAENKIWYFFVSTHTQELHYDCLNFLKDHGFVIIASADFDFGTYCFDGVLVARSEKIKGIDPIPISLRRANRPV